jgi:hypothetical protein
MACRQQSTHKTSVNSVSMQFYRHFNSPITRLTYYVRLSGGTPVVVAELYVVFVQSFRKVKLQYFVSGLQLNKPVCSNGDTGQTVFGQYTH